MPRESLRRSGYGASRPLQLLWSTHMLTFRIDRRSCFTYRCAIHCYSSRSYYLPDHDFRWTLTTDIRLSPWPQPRFRHSTPDTDRYYCVPRVQRKGLCGMGRLQGRRAAGNLGVSKRQEGWRASVTFRLDAAHQAAHDLWLLAYRLCYNSNRSLQVCDS